MLYIIWLGMGVLKIALNLQHTVNTPRRKGNKIKPNYSLNYLTSEASEGTHICN